MVEINVKSQIIKLLRRQRIPSDLLTGKGFQKIKHVLTMKKKYNLDCIKFKNSLSKHLNRIKVGHTVKKIIATYTSRKKLLQAIRKRQTTQYKNGQILEKKFHKKGNLNGQ